jgi:hypothetical protein
LEAETAISRLLNNEKDSMVAHNIEHLYNRYNPAKPNQREQTNSKKASGEH